VADVATLPVVSGHLGVDRPVLDGFSMGTCGRRSNGETRPEESSALVVAGCLPLSRTAFDQFGAAKAEPESAVDIGSNQAHLRSPIPEDDGA